jgi:hypothetical protein
LIEKGFYPLSFDQSMFHGFDPCCHFGGQNEPRSQKTRAGAGAALPSSSTESGRSISS